MKKYKIEFNNTDIKKLRNLMKNGLIARKTHKEILRESANTGWCYIVFKSKYSFDKFMRLQYSVFALYA